MSQTIATVVVSADCRTAALLLLAVASPIALVHFERVVERMSYRQLLVGSHLHLDLTSKKTPVFRL